MICRMIRRVNMPEYNPSLLGGLNWGGGSFAPSQYPTVVYMTFFLNDDIRKFFPGFDGTVYPIPRTKSNEYRSVIHYALAKYQ